jgi:hypothetical protein
MRNRKAQKDIFPDFDEGIFGDKFIETDIRFYATYDVAFCTRFRSRNPKTGN